MTDAAPPRRLLLVTYWYPPAVGAAAERMHSFAKYLPAPGWEVRVLTARQHDASKPDELGVTYVHDPWRRKEGAIADYNPTDAPTWSKRLRGFIREFVFPDRFVRWQRAAYDTGLSLIRDWKPDLLLASFPPASAVQLALRLHEATGVPMMLDYRDKWIGPGGYEPKRAAMRHRHEELERRALAASSAIVAVSEALIGDVVKSHARSADRISVIFNGFEPMPESPGTKALRTRDLDAATRIAHVGTVIARNRPELFFSSLILLAARQPEAVNDVHFRFVGNLSAGHAMKKILPPNVSTTGLVAREVAQAEMFKADALLLLTGAYVGEWGYSVKLFEYLQTGRPILCLEETPGSNDARLLRELAPERSFIGRLGDKDSLAEQLAALRAYLENESPPSKASIPSPAPALARFSRANQAANLAKFLDTIVKR